MFFTGWILLKFFTGTNYVSRVVSQIFSREGSSFHGLKTDFFHGLQNFFHGEKKTLSRIGIFSILNRSAVIPVSSKNVNKFK